MKANVIGFKRFDDFGALASPPQRVRRGPIQPVRPPRDWDHCLTRYPRVFILTEIGTIQGPFCGRLGGSAPMQNARLDEHRCTSSTAPIQSQPPWLRCRCRRRKPLPFAMAACIAQAFRAHARAAHPFRLHIPARGEYPGFASPPLTAMEHGSARDAQTHWQSRDARITGPSA